MPPTYLVSGRELQALLARSDATSHRSMPLGTSDDVRPECLPNGSCLGCADLYVLFKKVQTLPAAAKNINAHMKPLRENQTYLRNALRQCSNTIISRWKKQSRSKRTDILKETFPGVQRTPFDIVAWQYSEAYLSYCPNMHNRLLLPWLTVDDLASDPMRFLSLLHARVDYDIAAWTAFDLEQSKNLFHTGLMDTGVCGSAMIAQGPHYGEIVPWNKDQADQWHSIAFGRALVIVEAQSLLMGFLAVTVKTLINDARMEQVPTKWLDLVGSNFRRSKEDEISSSFICQAFQSPPKFDVDHILETAIVRAAKAQDHLWLLQTDSLYMHNEYRHLQDCQYWSQHAPRVFGKEDTYQRMGAILSIEPTQRLSDWRYVEEECKQLKEQHDIYRDMIKPGEKLPIKYDEALTRLDAVLRCILQRRSRDVRLLLTRLRGFEACFTSSQANIIGCPLATVAIHKSPSAWYKEDPLYWCLDVLLNIDPVRPDFLDAPFMFTVFEALMGSQSRIDSNRIEQRLADDLADLGAIWELLFAIRYHRPCRRRMDTLQALALGNTHAGCIRMAHEQQNFLDLVRFWEHQRWTPQKRGTSKSTLQTFVESFRSDVGSKENSEEERRRLTRQLLKRHWDAQRSIERDYLTHIGLSKADVQAHLASISYDLDPDYLESLEQPAKKGSRGLYIANKPPVTEATHQASRIEQEDESVQQSPPARVKAKTRPAQAADHNRNPEPAAHPLPAEDPEDHHQPIPVTPESYKIFMDMFPAPSPSSSSHPRGLTDWKKFVGAMTDAGFAATAHSGSAVSFTNPQGGRIIFHRPHPVAKVDRVMLASFGKRLNRWFGWERGCFVLAAKGDGNEKGDEIS